MKNFFYALLGILCFIGTLMLLMSFAPKSVGPRMYSNTYGYFQSPAEIEETQTAEVQTEAHIMIGVRQKKIETIDLLTQLRKRYEECTLIEDAWAFPHKDLTNLPQDSFTVRPYGEDTEIQHHDQKGMLSYTKEIGDGKKIQIEYHKEAIKRVLQNRKRFSKGTRIFWLFHELVAYFDGFLGPYFQADVVTEYNSLERYYFPYTTKSEGTPEDFWNTQIQTGKWWDLPLEGRQVLNKATKLYPGQSSEYFSFAIKGEIIYDVQSEDATYNLWINGDELKIVPGGKEITTGPHLSGVGRVKVQLSPFIKQEKTIRFIVERRA